MFDASAPSSQLVMAELSKPDIGLKLRKIAMWSTRSAIDAEDLVEEALLRVLDPEDRPWIPAERTFLTHMALVMKYVWDRQRQKVAAKLEVVDEGLARDKSTPSREPRADDALDRHRSLAVLRQLGERLRADFADGSLEAKILDVGKIEGTDEASELAKLLPYTYEEIRAGLKRVTYRAKQIREEYDASEERRMGAIRAMGATNKSEAAS